MGRSDSYLSGPWHYLWWLVRGQGKRVVWGALLGTTWMVGLTVPPLLLSFAIDDGLRRGVDGKIWLWAGILLVVGLTVAALAILRHRTMTKVRIYSAQQTIRAVAEQSIRLGSSLQRKTATGEVAAIGVGDAWTMARSLTVTGPGVGAVVAYIVIAIALMRISPLLAVVILVGVPALLLMLGPLLSRFRRHGTEHRVATGELSGRVEDIISGLRVLNTLGGKSLFAERWEIESDRVRRTGNRLATTESWIRGISVGLPSLFLAIVVWIIARMTAQGDMSVGDFVAVFGYVAVVVVPVSEFIAGAIDINRALISAQRTIDYLAISPQPHGAHPVHEPITDLFDPESGLLLRPGQFVVAMASDRQQAKAIIDRLSGLAPSDARWGRQLLGDVDSEQLRRSILPLDDGAYLFAGMVDDVVFTHGASDDEQRARIAFASGIDEMLRGFDDGWKTPIGERANELSGGQRQRIKLARALAAEPLVLLALDPLSAVDAITETRVIERVRDLRRAGTTLIFSDSATILGAADVVHVIDDGTVAMSGTHAELSTSSADYRRMVARDSDGKTEVI